ncbi:FlgD immunoglobulin-like domain containing protein [Candidatus Latescibacterota bacterium]
MHRFLVFLVMVFLGSNAFSASYFAPTPLRLISEKAIFYYPGITHIPLDIIGQPARVMVAIFTKDRAYKIHDIRNGYLGWHYVNKVDTCVYISDEYRFEPGYHEIEWDGLDNDGNRLKSNVYYFYLWGYGDRTAPVKAHYMSQGAHGGDAMLTLDDAGNPLPQPVHYGRAPGGSSGTTILWRWTLGSDPADITLLETCPVDLGEGALPVNYGHWLNPHHDPGSVYGWSWHKDEATTRCRRFTWVPNGVAVEDTLYDVTVQTLNPESGMEYDWPYAFLGESNHMEDVVRTRLHLIDIEQGEYIDYIDQSEVFESRYDAAYYDEGLLNGGWTVSTYYSTKLGFGKRTHEMIGGGIVIVDQASEWGVPGTYDGVYVSKTGTEGGEVGTWWVPRDSWRGLLWYDPTDVDEAGIPAAFSLHPNYPNPFNPITTIDFSIPESGFVTLLIYNIMGQKVRELVAENMKAGVHSVVWDGKDDEGTSVASGIYISRLKTGGQIAVQRMMVVR